MSETTSMFDAVDAVFDLIKIRARGLKRNFPNIEDAVFNEQLDFALGKAMVGKSMLKTAIHKLSELEKA